MTTRLTTPVRREIEIDGEPHTVIISADGVRVVRKRFRAGRSLTWQGLLERGDDELEQAAPRARP